MPKPTAGPRPRPLLGRRGIDRAGQHTHGYVPRDLGIGGEDDVHFLYCPDDGQIQTTFPVPPTAIKPGRE